MFGRRATIGLIFMLILMLGLVQLTQAATLDGLAFTVECGGFASQGGGLILDRDNTGLHRENIVISAVDGNGTYVFEPATDSFLIGARLSIPDGTFFAWTTQPAANPIMLTVVSPAGNGHEEQVIIKATAVCPSLVATVATTGILPADGVTSPTVPLNSPLPSATNSTDAILSQPGHVVVNAEHLFIRSGDGVAYTVVGVLSGGTELVVLGRNAKASWWYVQVGDMRGWVSNDHVVVRGDLRDTPVVRPIGELTPPTFVPFTDSPLLANPASNANRLCTIAASLDYQIVGRTATRSYYQIEATCNGAETTGWIASERGVIRNPAKLSAPVTG